MCCKSTYDIYHEYLEVDRPRRLGQKNKCDWSKIGHWKNQYAIDFANSLLKLTLNARLSIPERLIQNYSKYNIAICRTCTFPGTPHGPPLDKAKPVPKTIAEMCNPNAKIYFDNKEVVVITK